jgi:hypothetical protein
MKITTITVERNFHIMNDDRFIMEKISATAEFHEYDSANEITNGLREFIEENFKKAYPKVYTYLNFNEDVDINKPIINLHPLTQGISNNRVESEPYNYHSPDIEAVKKEMQSYKKNIGAKAFKSVYGEMVKDTPELKEIYEQKLKELQ